MRDLNLFFLNLFWRDETISRRSSFCRFLQILINFLGNSNDFTLTPPMAFLNVTCLSFKWFNLNELTIGGSLEILNHGLYRCVSLFSSRSLYSSIDCSDTCFVSWSSLNILAVVWHDVWYDDSIHDLLTKSSRMKKRWFRWVWRCWMRAKRFLCDAHFSLWLFIAITDW